ncbi:MAG: hypothetical protein ACE362_07830 [Phaeodactylibacter xiamenensis]|uniref:Uncharacterized protein n=1 Tax=Phaeodactylibacter xiamenensis TaxID=1524460 RepID=A0A098SF36_9BACT|nr:hypothetical protein [Phaeodactylibacter xiamenensis]KGE89577.1 hypothetical protein IX84_02045 [Phaeodactylibacter xiamenensis]MCR9054776.1 hypothetical protein [bacterium]
MKITLQQWCKSVVYTHTQWLKPQLMGIILASFVLTNARAQSSPSFIDYSDYFSYSTTVVQSLNTNSVCDGYRKDIYELEPEERAELAGLIIDYL